MEQMPNTIVINYLLPLGTIVLLKGRSHKLMIVGHNSTTEINPNENNEKCQFADVDGRKPVIYNYRGVIWPEGDALVGRYALFNEDEIEKVFFKGFIDKAPEDILEKIDAKINKINNSQK